MFLLGTLSNYIDTIREKCIGTMSITIPHVIMLSESILPINTGKYYITPQYKKRISRNQLNAHSTLLHFLCTIVLSLKCVAIWKFSIKIGTGSFPVDRITYGDWSSGIWMFVSFWEHPHLAPEWHPAKRNLNKKQGDQKARLAQTPKDQRASSDISTKENLCLSTIESHESRGCRDCIVDSGSNSHFVNYEDIFP